MKLATLRLPGRTTAVRIDGDHGTDLGVPDVGAVLGRRDWRRWAAGVAGKRLPLPGAGHSGADGTLDAAGNRPVDNAHEGSGASSYAPVVLRPGKIICVGLNYAPHIREMGRELPEYPTFFAKYPEALIGAHDDIELPPEAPDAVDWEAELAVVVGSRLRRSNEGEAAAAIAGYSVLNDVTMRDWQYRTPQWLQGKTFEGTTPFGPLMVTPDELGASGEADPKLADGVALDLSCDVDGEVMQRANTRDLVFSPARLLAYASQILTLNPGDVIATGTPGGVGHAREPKRYLATGSTVVTRIGGVGELRNRVTTA
ncbi:fumarylacetoacetate hydrolase family protein [Phytoactinopolyspora halotolerans]|uniref:Fumarylacetoacetate hydrolase family protein n=1 Tax=Phytoactinopolyspora halotolerans TaxID=1981512 RepID=A0A6L9SGY8_9ACTN|nr:fumarylacetoacetate hydrolase family protein [Phytoactinopolyspora halotolerans]NEE04417.1 fumarylacetoacetate hydrolase family protein [Phytoactinopolyspora halotolerans]